MESVLLCQCLIERPKCEDRQFCASVTLMLKKLRGGLLTVGWAGAGFVATAGWLYMITVAGWSIVKWFVG